MKLMKFLKITQNKVNIKEEGGNYIISVTKDTDFLKEAIKKQNSKVNMAGQNLDLNVDKCYFQNMQQIKKLMIQNLQLQLLILIFKVKNVRTDKQTQLL